MKALGTAVTDIYVNTKFNGTTVFGNQGTTGGVLNDNTGTTAAATFYYGENGGQSVSVLNAKTSALNDLTTETVGADTGTGAKDVTSALVEAAISEVDTTRAGYGALQNQLEHASNNMATTKENLQAAESRVRDVDMADEMMNYTKNNILLQASQAMLAQANQQPQGILQLLQ